MIVMIPTTSGASGPEISLLHRKVPQKEAANQRLQDYELDLGLKAGADRITWSKSQKQEPEAQETPTISILDR